MKTTILIKEGRKQIVFTPESDIDTQVVGMMKNVHSAEVYIGGFYDCQGGWTRERTSDNSLIIVFDDLKNE